MYTLIGSERSPFVRACRMLMLANSIPFEFRVLNFVDDPQDAAALEKESPINKVPVLLDGERRIFDSRVIVNFLIARHGLRPLTLDEENYLSAIYSCLDTGVTLFLMKRDGFDTGGKGFFLSRQRARIPANLEYLKSWAATLDPKKDWHFPAMALVSFLRWGEARAGVVKVNDYPKFAAFMDRFRGARGERETDFR